MRKDYAYIFERFYYFLEDQGTSPSGIIVFDELEKSRSHILVDQMDRYFKRTNKGQQRAGLIVPEPFFVHSDLTTGIQLADLVAYVTSWGFRFGNMEPSPRSDLADLAAMVGDLRYLTRREVGSDPAYPIWSFREIQDLGPRDDRDL